MMISCAGQRVPENAFSPASANSIRTVDPEALHTIKLLLLDDSTGCTILLMHIFRAGLLPGILLLGLFSKIEVWFCLGETLYTA